MDRYGFRANMSTGDALAYVKESINIILKILKMLSGIY